MRLLTCHRFLLILVIAALVGAACTSATDASSTFRVVLLPDTQGYTIMPRENNPYSAQTRWIKNHAAADNTRFAIHLGDVVENSGEVNSEWVIADDAHRILEEGPNPVPYSILPGNHDFRWYLPERGTQSYNNWFGPQRFAGKSWYGGHQGTKNDNNYCYFTGAGMDFMVLSLEYFPDDNAIAWANSVVQAHPSHRVILATHWYLKPDGTRHTEECSPKFCHDVPIYCEGNSGEEIWDKLIKDNDNIFMVVCGHLVGEAYHEGVNAAGHVVHEFLVNYQWVPTHPPNNGDGWLKTLDFDAENDTITLRSYSPTLDEYDLWEPSPFVISYDMDVVPEPSSFVLLGSLVFLIGVIVLLTIWRRCVRRPAGDELGQP